MPLGTCCGSWILIWICRNRSLLITPLFSARLTTLSHCTTCPTFIASSVSVVLLPSRGGGSAAAVIGLGCYVPLTEEVVKEVVKEEGTVGSREQGSKTVLKKGKVFSKVKKKKASFLEDDLALQKRKF